MIEDGVRFCRGLDLVTELLQYSSLACFMSIWQLCANLLIPNCLRSNHSCPPLAALELYVIGIKALRYQMIVFPACSFMMMANMMMQTCRKTIRANILAASRQGLFFIPLIIILPHYFGLLGVEICQAVSDLISLVVTIPIVWTALREMNMA